MEREKKNRRKRRRIQAGKFRFKPETEVKNEFRNLIFQFELGHFPPFWPSLFWGEKMFSSHGWEGQGKLKIIPPFLLAKIFPASEDRGLPARRNRAAGGMKAGATQCEESRSEAGRRANAKRRRRQFLFPFNPFSLPPPV